jgi:1-acyl-sn-glycerol-3-phosphate acyltransferase
MTTPRAIIMLVALYVSLTLWMVAGIVVFFLPRRAMIGLARSWSRFFLVLCRVFGNIQVEFRGLENIPKGPLLVASKHQSLWETFVLLGLFDDPCFILKRELTFIPLFGWYIAKMRNVPINRKDGAGALKAITRAAHREIRADKGRQIIVFPEGTRRPPGAPPQYRFGVAKLYEGIDVPCLPIGLNSGVCWPRNSLKLKPGTIIVDILPPIAPGMPRGDFFQLVQEQIEESSDRLLAEAQG